MPQRHRFRQSVSLKERLVLCRSKPTPTRWPKRDELLEKARKAETAVEMDGWANSRELQPPK
jgi:hypothetical protein